MELTLQNHEKTMELTPQNHEKTMELILQICYFTLFAIAENKYYKNKYYKNKLIIYLSIYL